MLLYHTAFTMNHRLASGGITVNSHKLSVLPSRSKESGIFTDNSSQYIVGHCSWQL